MLFTHTFTFNCNAFQKAARKLKSSELHQKRKQFGRLLIFHVTIKRAGGVEIEFVNNTDR